MFEVPLYMILATPDFVGPGVKRLAEIIRQSVGASDLALSTQPSNPD